MTDTHDADAETSDLPIHDSQSLTRRLVDMALPISLSLGIGSSITLIDSILVAPLGSSALAAVALTGSVTLVLVATFYGFLTLFAIRIAEAHARRDVNSVRVEFGSGIMLSVSVGLVGAGIMALIWKLLPIFGQPSEVLAILQWHWMFSAAAIIPIAAVMGYQLAVEAVDAAWLGTLIAILCVLLNTLFGFMFIHGYLFAPQLGLTGAGFASLLANSVAVVLAIISIKKWKSTRVISRQFSFSANTMLAQCRAGWASGAQYFLETGATAIAMLLIGVFGTFALAANQIVVSIAMMVYMLPLGISVAIGLLVARLRGEEQHHLIRAAVHKALLLVVAIMITAAVVFAIFGSNIASMFTDDPHIVATAVGLFFVFASMQLFDGIQSVSIGALRAFNDVTWPALVTTLCLWLVGLPLAAMFGHLVFRQAFGVWVGMAIGLCIASILLLRRLNARIDEC